jgi:hypothetical protein
MCLAHGCLAYAWPLALVRVSTTNPWFASPSLTIEVGFKKKLVSFRGAHTSDREFPSDHKRRGVTFNPAVGVSCPFFSVALRVSADDPQLHSIPGPSPFTGMTDAAVY